MKANREKSQIDIKFKELSLIESSDDDSDISTHYKSNIVSSNQNRTFSDDIKISNTTHFLHEPLFHSSILENPKELSRKQNDPIIIDLTDNNSDLDSPIKLLDESSKIPNKLTNNEANSLRMEKNRLEDIIRQFMKNIDTMKVSYTILGCTVLFVIIYICILILY